MFSIFKFVLPKAPTWFWGGLIVVIAAVGLFWASPELREVATVQARDFVGKGSVAATFPPGCVAVRIEGSKVESQQSEVRLTFKYATVSDMQRCNPRHLWVAGKSDVIDIASHPSNKNLGSRVTILTRNGVAVIGVRDTDHKEIVGALHCDLQRPEASALYLAEWGSFVPPILRLEPVKPEGSRDITYLADLCRDRVL
jgi:hypothetical protein